MQSNNEGYQETILDWTDEQFSDALNAHREILQHMKEVNTSRHYEDFKRLLIKTWGITGDRRQREEGLEEIGWTFEETQYNNLGFCIQVQCHTHRGREQKTITGTFGNNWSTFHTLKWMSSMTKIQRELEEQEKRLYRLLRKKGCHLENDDDGFFNLRHE